MSAQRTAKVLWCSCSPCTRKVMVRDRDCFMNYSDGEAIHLRRRIKELEGLLDAVLGVTHFSRREKQVWDLVAEGRSSKEIAEHEEKPSVSVADLGFEPLPAAKGRSEAEA